MPAEGFSRTHDLETLLSSLDDSSLEGRFSQALSGLEVPHELLEMNPGKPRQNIEEMYHRHHIHLRQLNLVYARPYASRYPMIGGHMLPNPLAIGKITEIVQDTLREEARNWRPDE
ncbi:MAG: hypothetical protein ACP5EN_06215 [Rhodovulum sp.]